MNRIGVGYYDCVNQREERKALLRVKHTDKAGVAAINEKVCAILGQSGDYVNRYEDATKIRDWVHERCYTKYYYEALDMVLSPDVDSTHQIYHWASPLERCKAFLLMFQLLEYDQRDWT